LYSECYCELKLRIEFNNVSIAKLTGRFKQMNCIEYVYVYTCTGHAERFFIMVMSLMVIIRQRSVCAILQYIALWSR